jgi:hypothetical protein
VPVVHPVPVKEFAKVNQIVQRSYLNDGREEKKYRIKT